MRLLWLMTRSFLLACLAVAALGYGLLLVPLAFLLHVLPFGLATFDRDRWLTADPWNRGCERGAMLYNLQRLHLRPGTPRVVVEAWLGPPDGGQPMRGRVRYGLGMCSGFRIDYDSLYVGYDARGRLTDSFHVQH